MASENASRTVGACFAHRAHIPYRRRPFLVPSFANARKEVPPLHRVQFRTPRRARKSQPKSPQHLPEVLQHPATASTLPQNTSLKSPRCLPEVPQCLPKAPQHLSEVLRRPASASAPQPLPETMCQPRPPASLGPLPASAPCA